MVRASDHFVWDEPLNEDAFTAEWNGNRYVCPRHPRLRMIEGALAFTNTYPTMPLLSERDISGYTSELAALKSASPRARSYILASPWHVPLRWFAAFSPSERELYGEEDEVSIRYRTAVGDAVDRIGWAVSVLTEAGFADGVVDHVRELEGWLTDFSAEAMLELDYARVARMFGEIDLALDESAVDVRESLEALERGAFDEAGEHYASVAGRWSAAQSLTYGN